MVSAIQPQSMGQASRIRRIAPNLLALTIGLGSAYALNWHTGDLVWSLWLSSLVLGYATILTAIGGGAYIGFLAIKHDINTPRNQLSAGAGSLFLALFFLGFFSLHFCGFHAGHSVFLHQFFPLEGLPEEGFGDAFMNPVLLWTMVFEHLIEPYGIFLIAALIAERKKILQPLFSAIKTAHEGKRLEGLLGSSDDGKGRSTKDSSPLAEAIGRPYLNVVRMHLLIFFFGFAHALKFDSFLVYTVVFIVYFFPWEELKRGSHQVPENQT